MTHPGGGSGTGPGGDSGTGPRTNAHELNAVANVDAYTSLLDIHIAAQLRRGYSPDQLDRDGHLLEVAR